MTPPELKRRSALFLDLDGTLLEIAATPRQVVVPPGLPALLAELHRLLEGALAIVTGRPLSELDELLRPFVSAAAGEHGASLRFDDGSREELPTGSVMPVEWRRELEAAAREWPGVLIEPKPYGLAVHYRLAPEHGDEVWRLVRRLVPSEHPGFRLVPAREAVEIGLRSTSKGHAVERLMARAPFRGRQPIFIGDDFTDEAGMEKARELGGIGLRVADVFGGDPANVRGWLATGARRLEKRSPPPPAAGATP
ncbi:MAG: trehalose-phosphatase [Proteobacteria bacterium]|nr:trehalose-phosphatase [Pseudomonadota bacterium]